MYYINRKSCVVHPNLNIDQDIKDLDRIIKNLIYFGMSWDESRDFFLLAMAEMCMEISEGKIEKAAAMVNTHVNTIRNHFNMHYINKNRRK